MIINNKEFWSRVYKSELDKRTSIPVLQDQYWLNIWETVEGAKDDFLIYDRCGHLNYHIRLPYAHLDYSIVESAIRVTHQGRGACLNCPTDDTKMSTIAMTTETPEEFITVVSYTTDIGIDTV